MQAFKIMGLLLLACALAVVALVLLKVSPRITPAPISTVSTFEECAAAGNPVMESYPRQCRSEDGRLFVEEIEFPYYGEIKPTNICAVAGCSGQLCVPAIEAGNIMTTCEFRAEYACYKEASCEPQSNGECGWTQTAELQQCLARPPVVEDGTVELEVM